MLLLLQAAIGIAIPGVNGGVEEDQLCSSV
jgi:hypothetical protein